MSQGTVTWFNESEGFGSIAREDGESFLDKGNQVHRADATGENERLLRKGDKTEMARTIDRQSLAALVKETLSKFPPQKDSDNARSFRLISVDYLEGKITHSQFNLLYTKGKTVNQITDGILNALNASQPPIPMNSGRRGEVAPKKWRLQQRKTSRPF